MKKKLYKTKQKIERRYLTIAAIILVVSPLLKLFIFDRYYDIEQFFVPDAYNYDVGKYAELGSAVVLQQFLGRGENLAGFDLQLSGEKGVVNWALKDSNNEIIREGEIKNAGESRISKIRFEPIKNSRENHYTFEFINEERRSGVQMSYSQIKYCIDCKMFVNDIEMNGNINMVPVYKAGTPLDFTGIIFSRIRDNYKYDN